MGISLNGLTPQNTYQGLLKFGDNSAISATLKAISDGNGNDTIIELSTSALQIGGSTGMYWDNTNKRLGIGTDTPTYNIDLNGTIRVQGGSGTYPFDVLPNGGFRLLNTSGNVRALNSFLKLQGTNGVQILSNTIIGEESTPSARLHIKGSGSTSATTSLLVQNSSATELFKVTDNGVITMGITGIGNTLNGTYTFTQNASFRGVCDSGSSALNLRFVVTGATKSLLINADYTNVNDASALVEIQSTTKGFLPPKMTTTQKNAIATPASGLQVYDNTLNRASIYSTAWENIITEVSTSPSPVSNLWSGTQAEYDALTPNASTLYFII